MTPGGTALGLPGRGGRAGRLLPVGPDGPARLRQLPGPYGDIINRIAVAQTKATGVVSAINFEYRGFDTVGEEFILFTAAIGVATVLRHLRGERERPARDEAIDRNVPAASDAVRMVSLILVGPTLLMGWFLTSHAQTSPSGGFQGGVVLATSLHPDLPGRGVPGLQADQPGRRHRRRGGGRRRPASPPSVSPPWPWACRICPTTCRWAAPRAP